MSSSRFCLTTAASRQHEYRRILSEDRRVCRVRLRSLTLLLAVGNLSFSARGVNLTSRLRISSTLETSRVNLRSIKQVSLFVELLVDLAEVERGHESWYDGLLATARRLYTKGTLQICLSSIHLQLSHLRELRWRGRFVLLVIDSLAEGSRQIPALIRVRSQRLN